MGHRLVTQALPSTIATAGVFDSGCGYDSRQLFADVTVGERQRYRELHHPGRARQYLASRWLLRRHLACELGMDPIDVPLQFGPKGPPTLYRLPHHLGLSHSHELCLCIVSIDAKAGCDVEHQRARRRDVNEIANAYFHPQEVTELDAAHEIRRLTDFYRLWTLKEAGHKALGQGIAGGLQRPSFSLRPVFRCLHPPAAAPWTFAAGELVRTSGRYSLALAVRSRPGAVATYEYDSGACRQPLDLCWDISVAAGAADIR